MDNTLVVRKLQKAELMILCDVDKVCRDNGLKYYMIGGTLLGAVRHKGFIPWDDDIDLVMFRKDYDKLCDLFMRDFSDKYFVQKFETDLHYTRYIMKIRLQGTKHIEQGVSDIQMNHGIYIDIFPMDYLKNDGVITHIRGWVFRALLAIKNVKHRTNHFAGVKKVLSKIGAILLFVVPDKLINCLFRIVCEADNKNDCKYITNFASHFKWKKQMYPISYFGDGVELPFEGHMFPAPKEYEKILERLYGNYMELPPENKRVSHNIVEIDFGDYEKVL